MSSGEHVPQGSLPSPPQITPADGRLAVFCVGLGAVGTTLIAGVESIRVGSGQPIGSLSQLGTVRLGRRDEQRVTRIGDLVPLASLHQLDFCAWDPFPDDAFVAASRAGVLDQPSIERVGRLPAHDPAPPGRVRPVLRHPGARAQHAPRGDPSPAGRGDQGRHHDLHGGQGLGPGRHGLVRVDRGAAPRSRGVPQPRGLRGGARPQRPGHRPEHALRLRRPRARASPSSTARRTCPSTRRRSPGTPPSTRSPSPARTSRPARPW